MARLTRGARNNNPLNIRISNNTWIGKCQNNSDGQFEQFITMQYGIRAAIINIRTHVRRNNNRLTLRQLIHIWAPYSDGNNEMNYVKMVCSRSGLKTEDYINIKDIDQITSLISAMSFVENGEDIITTDEIKQAYRLLYPSAA